MCKEKRSNIATLSLHFQKKHKLPEMKSKRNRMAEHLCKHCDTNFKSLAQLHRHWKTVKGDKASMCTVCFATFDNKFQIFAHRKTNEACNTGRSLCYQCGKTYHDNTALQKHIEAVHSNVKSFACRFCGKAFSCKGVRDRHEASHENKREFVCDVAGCGVAFNDAVKLRNHVRFIHELPKFVCTVCGKNLKRPAQLR